MVALPDDDAQMQEFQKETIIKMVLGDSEELFKVFSMLNEDGKKEAVKRVSELCQLPQYQKG